MSSIHEAIYKASHKEKRGRGPMPNFVALTSHQERQGDTTNDDFHQRLQDLRAEERQRRYAEGGSCGGYNDRQDPRDRVAAARATDEDDNFAYDEFGRRKRSRATEDGQSGSKAQAALERLRQNVLSKRTSAAGSKPQQQQQQQNGMERGSEERYSDRTERSGDRRSRSRDKRR
mmetsp:Transcript_116001/g.231223  ORF Transcript_116001/g.231223 Transcript_116001/m.231223 type:complete len:174 (-) Transcript_116001:98-619(-)